MLTYEIVIKNLTSDDEAQMSIPAGDRVLFSYDYIGDGEKKYMFRFIEYLNDLTQQSELNKLMEVFKDLQNYEYSFSATLKNTELNTNSEIVNIDKIKTIDLRGELNSSGSREVLKKYAFMRVLEVV